MKILSLVITSIFALSMFSCQKEEVQQNGRLVSITATHQSSPDLKTNIGAPGTYTVTCNAADKLAVFDATKYTHLEAKDFMAASPVTVTKTGADQPAINFSFQHLMAILDIEVTNKTGAAVTVTQITLVRTDMDFTTNAGWI